ncbi:MAG: hypothetical protein IPJ37_05525 [Bacteroidales bacterium]|nr:hypothetical protein [Bacteroidales bacterium]
MKNKIIDYQGFIITFLAPIFLFLLVTQNISAQQIISGEINKTYQLTLNDGSVISGRLLLITEKEVIISSATIGEIRLQKENIKSMTPVLEINHKTAEIWFDNPNPSKYLLGNSAIPMEKHTGYYQNTWIFVNSFSYAFTGNISLAGGFEIISAMAAGEGPFAFYINPKVSFKLADNFYAGGNILYANTLRTLEDFGGLATLNAFATYGNKNNNLTGAVGFGWADGEFSSKPLLTISGMVRASKRIAFVTENWIVPGINDTSADTYSYYGIFSYGIRFLGEKTSIDLAFINNPDIASEIIIGIPWLDFVINF